MRFYIYLFKIFMRAYLIKMMNYLKEPFEGLFTQGMVCHETYKDSENIG